MTGRQKEIVFGLSFVTAYTVLSHFIRSTAIVSAVIFGIFVALPIVLCVSGWWRWQGVRRNENTPRWRQMVGLSALVTNTSVVCLVWLFFSYSIFFADTRHSYGSIAIDPYPVVVACLILSLAMLAMGMAAPRRIRLAVVLGGFTMSWLILVIIGGGGVL